ncbi:MAG: 5-formyltetrahydrofolate cyclo-ligase [Deltaproteobacteria bacterium]|nr:5-formyltetrahydrofolate cyclo-ligase [Deltaproteobacteria bacterium]
MVNTVTKESLRAELLGRRSRLSFEEVYRLSLMIQKRFTAMREFRSAKRLVIYSSFRNEVLTDEIFLRAVGEGKEVYFPRVVRLAPSGAKGAPHLSFYMVKDRRELSPGSYNILEPPHGGVEAGPEAFDCAVVPGVAFDTSGTRLGYGKGYYDRVLTRTRCPVVALAFGFQCLAEALPSEPHDVRVDSIVTENKVLRV